MQTFTPAHAAPFKVFSVDLPNRPDCHRTPKARGEVETHSGRRVKFTLNAFGELHITENGLRRKFPRPLKKTADIEIYTALQKGLDYTAARGKQSLQWAARNAAATNSREF